MSLFTRIFSRKISAHVEYMCTSLRCAPDFWWMATSYGYESLYRHHSNLRYDVHSGRFSEPVQYTVTRREKRLINDAIREFKMSKIQSQLRHNKSGK